jgi:hypothetical protein
MQCDVFGIPSRPVPFIEDFCGALAQAGVAAQHLERLALGGHRRKSIANVDALFGLPLPKLRELRLIRLSELKGDSLAALTCMHQSSEDNSCCVVTEPVSKRLLSFCVEDCPQVLSTASLLSYF